MSGTYKNYMRLLESWPLDPTKTGRDLGLHIRDQIKIAFAKGESSQVDKELCDRYYASLKRLASNHYGSLYKRTLTSTASGLTVEQCNLALSPELQEFFAEEERSYFSKARRTVQYYLEKDKKDKDHKES
ncbi:ubiquinol-cytochrome-c reductase complex assembly factor 2-like [Orussus abietinus]|uniref:ubiquinol-cytochrome-c reductase complex assembly factor 2-like n=1 Tax=Orussus abietinus TaxID=222816 RepID=UPI0006268C01|nr:ubiquinol-cytochrome-c reductase complex assembly factor 2-like [Orussus abietinus]